MILAIYDQFSGLIGMTDSTYKMAKTFAKFKKYCRKSTVD